MLSKKLLRGQALLEDFYKLYEAMNVGQQILQELKGVEGLTLKKVITDVIEEEMMVNNFNDF